MNNDKSNSTIEMLERLTEALGPDEGKAAKAVRQKAKSRRITLWLLLIVLPLVIAGGATAWWLLR